MPRPAATATATRSESTRTRTGHRRQSPRRRPSLAPPPASTAPPGTSRRASPPSARSARKARPDRARSPRPVAARRPPARPTAAPPRRSPADLRARASGQAAVPALRGSRSRSVSPPGRSQTTLQARPDTPDWRQRADRRAPAPAGARAQPVRARHRGRAWTRSLRPGPTVRRTHRAGAVRRGESPPRRIAGTPRVIVLGVERDPSERTPISSADCARSVVLPYPRGRDEGHERNERCAQESDDVRLGDGAVGAPARSELDLDRSERRQQVRPRWPTYREQLRAVTPRRPAVDRRCPTPPLPSGRGAQAGARLRFRPRTLNRDAARRSDGS